MDVYGVDHSLCYLKKKCDVHQKHYSTIEKEALALILALKHFDVYVSGAPLLGYTDHIYKQYEELQSEINAMPFIFAGLRPEEFPHPWQRQCSG